jgi:hypothetical protein
VRVAKRAYAEAIARHDHLFQVLIEDGHDEIAFETLGEAVTESIVCGEREARIRSTRRDERMITERASQLDSIVETSVEGTELSPEAERVCFTCRLLEK